MFAETYCELWHWGVASSRLLCHCQACSPSAAASRSSRSCLAVSPSCRTLSPVQAVCRHYVLVDLAREHAELELICLTSWEEQTSKGCPKQAVASHVSSCVICTITNIPTRPVGTWTHHVLTASLMRALSAIRRRRSISSSSIVRIHWVDRYTPELCPEEPKETQERLFYRFPAVSWANIPSQWRRWGILSTAGKTWLAMELLLWCLKEDTRR